MTNLSKIIDDLGTLKATIANLEIEEKALKAALQDLPVGAYDGEVYRLNITAPEREKLSDEIKASIKALTEEYRASLSPQYRTAHIKQVAVPTFTVRRRTDQKAAA